MLLRRLSDTRSEVRISCHNRRTLTDTVLSAMKKFVAFHLQLVTALFKGNILKWKVKQQL